MMLSKFSLSHLRFTLDPLETIRLQRMNKGITLRGAFGTAFRQIVCHDLKADCAVCTLHPSCPYGIFFAPIISPDSERLRLNRDIPRPFVIKPPLDGKDRYGPGDRVVFDLVLVGRAIDFLPYLLVSFKELGQRGIGAGRGRFRVRGVESLDASGGTERIWDEESNMVHAPQKRVMLKELGKNIPGAPGPLRLHFLTPVLLKDKDQWVKPFFGPLMRRLRDRIRALSYFYCGETLEMDFNASGEDYGLERIQFSGFQGELNRNRRGELCIRIEGVLGNHAGKVLILPVCEKDLKERKEILVSEEKGTDAERQGEGTGNSEGQRS